jgi:nickel/cobalt transporter (NicO) family protein
VPATFSYVPGLSSSSIPRFLNPATGGFRIIQDQYASLIAQKLTPLVILLSIVLSVGLGAAHALSPGHGKAVMAGYLVGTRRSPKHAVILGATITVTHTVGVFALGLVTLFAALISPERLYPWLTLISGALVILLGVTLMISRTRLALVRGEPGDHPHDHHQDQDHDHPHDHDHDHEHEDGADPLEPHSHGLGTHSHAVPAGAGTASLLMMGITGGLIPCPSALIVLLSAIELHRVLLGIVLIVAFSIGLALVLTGIGVALARGLPLLSRIPGSRRLGSGLRVIRFASVGGALVLTIAGMGLTLQAIPQVL